MEQDWWEKTVEYAFVVAAFQAGKCDLAAPLSGKHERLVGDALFGADSRLVLIEFKRDAGEIPTEESLFHNVDEARRDLWDYEHHHIVFGALSAHSPMTLELAAETYFSRKPRESALASLSFGIDGEEFRRYVKALANLKKEDGRSTSGHISPEALSSVMSVSQEGQLLACKPLYDFAPGLFYGPERRVESTPSPSEGCTPS